MGAAVTMVTIPSTSHGWQMPDSTIGSPYIKLDACLTVLHQTEQYFTAVLFNSNKNWLLTDGEKHIKQNSWQIPAIAYNLCGRSFWDWADMTLLSVTNIAIIHTSTEVQL